MTMLVILASLTSAMISRVTSGNRREQLSLVLVVYPDRSSQLLPLHFLTVHSEKTKWRNQLQTLPIVFILLAANWCHFLPNCGLVGDQRLTINLKTLPFVFSPNCTCQTASEEKDKTATSWRKCSLSEILKWGRLVTRVHETYRL